MDGPYVGQPSAARSSTCQIGDRMSWVEVIGTYSPHEVVDEINSGIIPFIQASSVTRIDPPSDPYGS